MQHEFVFVPKSEWLPLRNEIEELLHLVQDEVRECFTFSYTFVGSTKRNLITKDLKSNVGYDFDINIHVNDEDEDYSAEEIKRIIRLALDKYSRRLGYGYCEDSTRVLTIKKVNTFTSSIVHSCDFCIVYDCGDGRQQYVHFNKAQRSYEWKYLPVSNKELERKAEWLSHNRPKREVEDLYLYKKNNNTNPNNKSRSLYAQTIEELYKKYNGKK